MDSLPSAPSAPSETPDETIRRLTAELREARDQQAATAELLQTINASPGDLAPVFDAMLEKAIRLCGGVRGALWTIEDAHGRLAAARGLSAEFIALLRERGESGTNPPLQQIIAGKRLIEFPDTAESEFYRAGDPLAHAAVEAGVRSLIWVALVREGVALGAFAIGRPTVGPFSDQQIALLQNFAAQAVIAMENARLLTETREALEQQTATAEVLQVINSSPGDLAPVFDAMLEKALRLCEAAFGSLVGFDGERFQTLAQRGLPPPYVEYLATTADQPGPGGGQQRVLHGERVVHFADMKDDEAYRSGKNPMHRAMVDIGGARTGLIVPLRKDEAVVGTFTIYRQEVRPFTGKQIALLQNFAAQAVIAMENARLLTETREALEQQTATAEVLQVINSSPGDLAPVFDAMLDKAIRLCGATYGHLFTYDGERFHLCAARSDTRYIEWARRAGPVQPDPSTPLGRLIRGERIVHVADIREDEGYQAAPIFRESVELRGVRSQVAVALIKDNVLLGAMNVYRQEVRPFSDKQVALLENFAAQAVIAMENTRLITETREALD
jgi:GAF domain-containing protein